MSELADGAGINRATCYSTVIALTELGLLHRDERRKSYGLGWRLVSLGDAATAQFDGYRPARVEMFRLSEELGVSGLVCVALEDYEYMVVLDHVGSDRLPSRPRLTIGEADPIRPPLGMIFMAWEPDHVIEAWLARTAPGASTQELLAYRDALNMVRLRGYSLGASSEVQLEAAQMLRKLRESEHDGDRSAIAEALGTLLGHTPANAALDQGDLPIAVNYLIAPVFGPDGHVALTITLWGSPGQLTVDNLDEYARPLLASARRVTTLIGGRMPRAESLSLR